jgi:hypothetical protein
MRLFSLIAFVFVCISICTGRQNSFIPHKEKIWIDSIPTDSTYYLPLDTAGEKSFPQRKKVKAAYGYSHLAWSDMEDFPRAFSCDKYLQLTDGLLVMNCNNGKTNRVQLSDKQIDSLYAFINDSTNFDLRSEPDCFLPRHTFIFCNEKNRVIGYIGVCFECHKAEGTPALPRCNGEIINKGYAFIQKFCEGTGLTMKFPD